MTFAMDYLQQLERIGTRLSLPAVRTLHLPPLSDGVRKWGEFCALELEDGSLGLSYVMLGDTLERLTEAHRTLGLEGADALAVARGYVGGHDLQRTLGFAAANAITRHFFDRATYAPPDSTDSIGGLQPQTVRRRRVGRIAVRRHDAREVVAEQVAHRRPRPRASRSGAR